MTTAAHLHLSARELEVAQAVALGLMNVQIADRLSLRPKTVERHLANIYEAMGDHDYHQRVTLARIIYEGKYMTHGWVTPGDAGGG